MPEVWLAAIIVRGEDGVLVGQRPPTGLWGGLYEPPMVPAEASFDAGMVVKAWTEAFGCKLAVQRRVGSLRHVLTHRIIHVHVVEAECSMPAKAGTYAGLHWIQPENLAGVGVSALTRRLLEAT